MKAADRLKLTFQAEHIAHLARTHNKITPQNWRDYEATRGATLACLVAVTHSLLESIKRLTA